MTNDKLKSTISDKKRPAVIIFGLASIGLCLWFCSITIYSVLDSTFASMGGLIMLTIASCAAFLAFGMARFLTYANNEVEAWAALPCVFSTIALCASGMTVCFLVGTLLPKEVEYRSLNVEGYKWLYSMVFCPLAMVWTFRLLRKIEKLTNPSLPVESPRRRPLVQFVRQNWLKDFIVTVLLYLVLTISAFVLLVADPPMPVSEEHLTYEKFYRKDEFPADGSDYGYRRSAGSFECEFSISEEGFQNWAKTRADWVLYAVPATDPVHVTRAYPKESIKVVDGLIARRIQDGSHRVFEQAVFDRSQNRVYYNRSIR